MMAWLKTLGVKRSDLLICAEYTGVYTNTLIEFADRKGIALSLNSPLDIKRSIGLVRGKNDAVDAARIAEFAYRRRENLRLYEKPCDAIMKMQYLLTERRQYVRQRTALMNLHSAMGPYETPSGLDHFGMFHHLLIILALVIIFRTSIYIHAKILLPFPFISLRV